QSEITDAHIKAWRNFQLDLSGVMKEAGRSVYNSPGEIRIVFDLPRLPQVPPLVGRHQAKTLSQPELEQFPPRRLDSRPAEGNPVGVTDQIEQEILKSHELRQHLGHRDIVGRSEAASRFELHSRRRFHRANHKTAHPGALVRAFAEPAVYPRAV